ncbi:6174_t:CDS:10 [Ambispora leptoticha]|uniref:6174_t:CDS:1 n=1 Tax=Ambispora leptoticha TaxID=144679 RepID=A0A9N8VI48_9GLOM|nr:6174_t:CDS:10 [Ambispora leptoticha]
MARFETLDHHTDEALEKENWYTLNNMIFADLIALCQERGLPTEGEKEELIKRLLDWKLNTRPVPAPSTPKLISTDGVLCTQPGVINSSLWSTLFINGEIPVIDYDKLEVGKKLGSGGFKDCYAGTYEGGPVAIGELRIVNFTESDFQEMKHEIDVLKQLRHENIIEFIGVCTNTKHLCIVTELCDNGDLFDYMRKVPRPTFSQQIMYMHDIALGIAYLHNRRPSIIHRDLKSMNILISSDLRAKINDFGLARIRPRANASMHTQCGTPNWQAPEFWASNPRYTEKVDVYACGLIFWEILTWSEEGYPYQNFSEHQLYEAVKDRGIRPPLEKLKTYPQSLIKLIQDMWQKEPKKRPSMGTVVEKLVQYLS